MTLHEYQLPEARDRLTAAGLDVQLDTICGLPGVEDVHVFPDVTVKPWGFPSGLVIHSRDFLYPLAVPDPGSGYHVSTLPFTRAELSMGDVEAVYQAILSAADPRLRRREGASIDIDRVLDEGLAYGGTGAPALLPRRRCSGLFDDGFKVDLHGSLGGADGHYVAVQWVQEVLDPDLASRQGLEAGQLVLIIHIGARPMREYIYLRYGMPAAEESLQEGISTGEQVAAGMFAVPRASPWGEAYLGCAMASANFGYFNRRLVHRNVQAAIAAMLRAPEEDLARRACMLQHQHHTELAAGDLGRVTASRGVQRVEGGALAYVAGGEFGPSYLMTAADRAIDFGNLCGHGIPEWQPTREATERAADCVPHAAAATANAPFDLETYLRDVGNLEETAAHTANIGMARPVARLYPLINFRSPEVFRPRDQIQRSPSSVCSSW